MKKVVTMEFYVIINIQGQCNCIVSFAKDCLLTLVKSRLALGSPSCSFVCSFVTMLKIAQYTGKWLLTAS